MGVHPWADGEIGRRTTLKMWRPYGHASSSLALPIVYFYCPGYQGGNGCRVALGLQSIHPWPLQRY